MSYRDITMPLRDRVAAMAVKDRVLTIVMLAVFGIGFLVKMLMSDLIHAPTVVLLHAILAGVFVGTAATFVTDWVHGGMDWDQ